MLARARLLSLSKEKRNGEEKMAMKSFCTTLPLQQPKHTAPKKTCVGPELVDWAQLPPVLWGTVWYFLGSSSQFHLLAASCRSALGAVLLTTDGVDLNTTGNDKVYHYCTTEKLPCSYRAPRALAVLSLVAPSPHTHNATHYYSVCAALSHGCKYCLSYS